MSDIGAIALAGLMGIVGTLAAVWLTYVLQRKSHETKDTIDRELAHLDALEAGFKQLAAALVNDVLVPNPLSGRRGLTAIRELMYVSPMALSPGVVTQFLNVYEKATQLRSYRALARRWVFGDIAEAKVVAEELALAEGAIAAEIATRRRKLVDGQLVRFHERTARASRASMMAALRTFAPRRRRTTQG